MCLASSDAKKATKAAISSVSPSRVFGVLPIIPDSISGLLDKNQEVLGVLMGPGATALTVIP
jgi:3-oxoacyl-[acyl-carrier-protein] synthase III